MRADSLCVCVVSSGAGRAYFGPGCYIGGGIAGNFFAKKRISLRRWRDFFHPALRAWKCLKTAFSSKHNAHFYDPWAFSSCALFSVPTLRNAKNATSPPLVLSGGCCSDPELGSGGVSFRGGYTCTSQKLPASTNEIPGRDWA